MKRFVLACSKRDYRTPTPISFDAVRENGAPFLEAVEQLADHVAATHGIGPRDTWSFSLIEVEAAGADLWATEIVGEQP